MTNEMFPCTQCNGSGREDRENYCEKCNGSGENEEEYYDDIPENWREDTGNGGYVEYDSWDNDFDSD